MVSESLRGVVSQQLVPRLDGKGRIAALEIMVCNTPVANLIREGKTFQIPSVMQTGKRAGMQTLDDAILELLNKKWISPEEAYEKCTDKSRFTSLLKTVPDELT